MSLAASPASAAASHRETLLGGAILPTLLRLTIPTTVAMLATALAAVAETTYVGLLGVAPLAAMALVFPMAMLMQMMSAGAMGGGVSSAISRAIGAGDINRANALALHAIAIAGIAAAVFTLFFLSLGPAIYALLGGRGEALAQAVVYSNTLFIGAICIWMFNTLSSVLRGTGNMNVPSLLGLLVAGAQVVIGGCLGLGLGPLPRLGMVGLALGQLLAFGGGALVLLWFLRSGRARLLLRFRGTKFQRGMFMDILKVGAIACLSPLQTVATVLVFTGLVARFGTEALAGYGIGARLEFLLVPIAFSVGVASVPMVGMAIGAGLVARARRVAWTAGGVAALALGLIGLVVVVAPDLWAGLFTRDAAVLDVARQYLVAAGPGFALFGAGLCLYFASQGAGRIVGPVLAASARLLLVMIGGWWLTSIAAPLWTLFALAGAAMALYGFATAGAVYFTRWGKA
ncbi:MATE family efflux transporter [Ferrovibrio sp.]|uniref:MATE family efflux transporter n=1 Tax=Ferrovibrio sp. TaxID=1917215 RepID=UPI001B4F3507|nr:MATE family efflux transporter [Ferrovibrio sp.]MBP7063330.1 MATE family efflux transporter [Ferrovibrio sp.]